MKLFSQKYISLRLTVCSMLMLGYINSNCKVFDNLNIDNLNIEALKPRLTVINDKEQTLSYKVAKLEAENDSKKIVNRRYQIVPYYMTLGEHYTKYIMFGEVEYADGTVISGESKYEGMLAVGDMDLSAIYDKHYLPNEMLYSNTLTFPSDDHQYYHKYRKSKIVLNDLYYGQMGYEALRNLDKDGAATLDFRVIMADGWTQYPDYDTYSMTGMMDNLRKDLINNGIDPENFSAVTYSFSPSYYVRLWGSGLRYKDEGYPFTQPMIFAVFHNTWYIEGGLGKNCTLFLKMDYPTTPQLETSIERMPNRGGYMDSWKMRIVLTASHCGVPYTYEYETSIFLPFPTDPEKIEAARAAGYTVP